MYQSETAQLLAGPWDGMNHGDGKMYDRDGNLLSAPDNTEPFPANGVKASQLAQWQADHPLFQNQVYVDGTTDANKVGYPGVSFLPPLYLGSVERDGEVWYVPRTDVAPAAPTPVIIAPVVPRDRTTTTYIQPWPVGGQVRLFTKDLTRDIMRYVFAVPPELRVDDGSKGFIHITEVAGQGNYLRDLQLDDGFGGIILPFSGTGGVSPNYSYKFGSKADADIALPLDLQYLALSVLNVNGEASEILIDFASPDRVKA